MKLKFKTWGRRGKKLEARSVSRWEIGDRRQEIGVLGGGWLVAGGVSRGIQNATWAKPPLSTFGTNSRLTERGWFFRLSSSMRTISAKAKDVARKWYLVDAGNQVVGREDMMMEYWQLELDRRSAYE